MHHRHEPKLQTSSKVGHPTAGRGWPCLAPGGGGDCTAVCRPGPGARRDGGAHGQWYRQILGAGGGWWWLVVGRPESGRHATDEVMVCGRWMSLFCDGRTRRVPWSGPCVGDAVSVRSAARLGCVMNATFSSVVRWLPSSRAWQLTRLPLCWFSVGAHSGCAIVRVGRSISSGAQSRAATAHPLWAGARRVWSALRASPLAWALSANHWRSMSVLSPPRPPRAGVGGCLRLTAVGGLLLCGPERRPVLGIIWDKSPLTLGTLRHLLGDNSDWSHRNIQLHIPIVSLITNLNLSPYHTRWK